MTVTGYEARLRDAAVRYNDAAEDYERLRRAIAIKDARVAQSEALATYYATELSTLQRKHNELQGQADQLRLAYGDLRLRFQELELECRTMREQHGIAGYDRGHARGYAEGLADGQHAAD